MPDPVTPRLYVLLDASPGRLPSSGDVLSVREASPAEVLAHPAAVAEIAHLDEYIAALHAFALRCQRAHATPGCEREPLADAAWCLDRLAKRVEETADAREALTAERDRLRAVLAAERGERGRPGWKYDGFAWTRGAGCRTLYAVRGRDVSSLWSWSGPPHGAHGTERTALEAMEAADRAAEGREG